MTTNTWGGAVTVMGSTVTGLALKVGPPIILKTIGFTAAGPAAGSTAAAWMSSIAVGNGVGVAAGSWYAACQSAAMGGMALIGAPTVLTVAAVPAVGYVGYQLYRIMS